MYRFPIIPLLILLIAFFQPSAMSDDNLLQSPDGQIVVSVDVNEEISYSIQYQKRLVLDRSVISMTIQDVGILGPNARVVDIKRRSVNDKIYPPVRVKRKEIMDKFNEIELLFQNDWSLIFRAYDDGVAYRFATSREGEMIVQAEQAKFHFAVDGEVYYAAVDCDLNEKKEVDCFHSDYEEPYQVFSFDQISSSSMAVLPVLVDLKEKGPFVVITESDLEDYPGMYLTKNPESARGLTAIFPRYPVTEEVRGGEFKLSVVTQRADFIAKTAGAREFPWRVLVIVEEDDRLIETDIVYRLSDEQEAEDVGWIKPGKSTSEWLYENTLYDVDFRAGYNTETYKYYIDFAKKFDLEYVLFDAGWSDPSDIFDLTPEIDMEFLSRYAKEQGVGLVLWTSALAMSRQMGEALDLFQRWGIKGIMVDFMNRDDQKMVQFYHRVAKETAKYQIFVDFHGAYKSAGLERKYPNIITREGFIAFEYNKMSEVLSPEYEVTLPFIRMIAGPMDYEPGAMRNATREHFKVIWTMPMSQGTRVHQLAMFIVYESPYSKMGGNPADYMREPEFTQFIVDLPTVWDETRVLDAQLADYVVVLRQSAQGDYYIGAMNDWSVRDLEIDFSFLGTGDYQAIIYQDGINADRYAGDYKRVETNVNSSDRMPIHLAPGGGWVAKISKKK